MKKKSKITILDNGFNRFQTQCFGCGCVFEYDIKNIKFYKSGYGVVKCPICGRSHEHKLKEDVRREDVFAKYKDEIKKELTPKIAEDMIDCVNMCIRDRLDFGTEDDFDYEMISKWWERASSRLSERYERPNPFMKL
jgi:transcription elongation factor Elf1